MHPHDYYAPYSDEPKLHNRGAARPYIEPDWQANAAGHQLPVLSTVGRGPRGEGLEVGNVVNEDGTVSFALYSTLTGELVWQSPNLAPSKIEFLPTDFRDLAAGQPAPMDIKVTRGGITETTHAYLPCGEQGSLIYTLDAIVPWNRSQTYQTTVNDLIIYGNQHWNNGHKPMPKVNDIIVVKLQEEDKVVLAIADIVQVGSTSEDEIALDSPVVYVVRTMIDNVGPKGDKGDPGESDVHTWEASGQWFVGEGYGHSWNATRLGYDASDQEYGYVEPWAFICHVDEIEQFIPISYALEYPLYFSTTQPPLYESNYYASNGGSSFGGQLVSLSTAWSEWNGPSYVWAQADDGFDIYFCPRDNYTMPFSDEAEANAFVQEHPTYRMFGTYMIIDDPEHSEVINGSTLNPHRNEPTSM